MNLYIGIDAGGTKTHLLAATVPETTPLEQSGPAANPHRQGFEGAADVLARLIRQAGQHRPEATLRSVYAGVAGAGSTADQQLLAGLVRQRLTPEDPPHLSIAHDGLIALEGAFEGGSGVIVVAGTGSVAYARTTGGALRRVGGWGYLFGDEGSGHALGASAFKAVAAAFDGGPPTRLRTILADRFGLTTPDEVKRWVYREHQPIQTAAPLVIEAARAGDAEALRIIDEQTAALARQVAWLAGEAADIEPRLALLGGLAGDPFYRKALTGALLETLPGWHLEDARHPPVGGALRLALASAE